MKTIAIDFDGVLVPHDTHEYENENRKPRNGALEFLKELNEKFNIIIFTTEDVSKVDAWFRQQCLSFDIKRITNIKPKCDIYLDDKGLYFNGDFDKALKDIENFKSYWE